MPEQKTDAEKLRTIVEFFQKCSPITAMNFIKSKDIQDEILEIAGNVERKDTRLRELKESNRFLYQKLKAR